MSMFHELMMKKKGMPSRYQEVEYIESTGTQYIDTGVMADDTTGLNIEVQSLLSSDRILIGSRVAGTDSRFYIGSTANYYIGWNVYNTIEIPYSQKAQISVNFYNNRSVYGDGVFKQNVSGTLATQNSNIVIFGTNSSGNVTSLSSCKMYNVKISQGNQLVRNFIPVYDTETNKYGMWESVQGKFYGNDGTGDFGGSIVGYTVVGSPTITDGVVSGFSSANYLRINGFPKVSADWEIKIKAKPQNNTSYAILMGSWADSSCYITFRKNELSCEFGNGRIIKSGNFDATIFYFIKVTKKGTKISLYYSTDDINYILCGEKEGTLSGGNADLMFGNGNANWGRAYPYENEIDLNETYIKINNKLWFNGQQA